MSIYVYDFVVIGTDTYYGETPEIAAITDANKKTETFYCNKILISDKLDSQIEKYDNDLNLANCSINFTGTAEIQPLINPRESSTEESNAVKLSDFYKMVGILRKTYQYIYSTNYQIMLANLYEAGKCIRVNFTNMNTEYETGGLRKLKKLEFEGGKANNDDL